MCSKERIHFGGKEKSGEEWGRRGGKTVGRGGGREGAGEGGEGKKEVKIG